MIEIISQEQFLDKFALTKHNGINIAVVQPSGRYRIHKSANPRSAMHYAKHLQTMYAAQDVYIADITTKEK